MKNQSNLINSVENAAREHLIQPWDDIFKLGEQVRPVITGSENIYLLDSQGRKLIDGPGGMWCSQIGYGRQEIADTMSQQALNLSYNSPWYTTSGPAAQLSEKIAALTPGDLNHVFFTTGGSTAVDSALRLVQLYQSVRGKPGKKTILARIGGYHGSTHLSAACSGSASSRKNFDVDREPVSFLTQPNPLKLPKGIAAENFCDYLLEELEQRIEELGRDNIGALIAEPVQASGGVIVPLQGYLAGMRKICSDNDILYISDEVVTGFGRCGSWFASEEVFGIMPDIITFAKGVTSGYIPLGGYAVSDRLLTEIAEEAGESAVYSNGYTYSGHPIACAVALTNMEIFEKEGILEHVRNIAPYFKSSLESLRDIPIVKDVRTAGLIGAVECELTGVSNEELGKLIDQHCVDMGLIVRPIDNICVMSPPLIITREQIDEMTRILRAGIEKAST